MKRVEDLCYNKTPTPRNYVNIYSFIKKWDGIWSFEFF